MAYRRSLTTSARLVPRSQPFAPAFSFTNHKDDRKNSQSDEKVTMRFLQSRSFGNNATTWQGFGGGGMSFGDPKRSQFLPVKSRFMSARNMSTVNGVGTGEKIGRMADEIAEKTMEFVSSQAAAFSEVAVAATDPWTPVAALQCAINGIHIYTGLNWWASIAITTLVIRASISTSISIFSRYRSNGKGSIKNAQDDKEFEGNDRKQSLSRTPSNALFIQGPIFVAFDLAIQNMVETVPSFQTGGIAWFTDLSTTDSFCILPYLAAFSFWPHIQEHLYERLNVDSHKQERFNGGFDMKKVVFLSSCGFIVPFVSAFPNALLCYWITNNSFPYLTGITTYLTGSIIQKKQSVKKWLDTPRMNQEPPSPTGRSSSRLDSVKENPKKFLNTPPSPIGGSSSRFDSTLDQMLVKPEQQREAMTEPPPSSIFSDMEADLKMDTAAIVKPHPQQPKHNVTKNGEYPRFLYR